MVYALSGPSSFNLSDRGDREYLRVYVTSDIVGTATQHHQFQATMHGKVGPRPNRDIDGIGGGEESQFGRVFSRPFV